MAAYITAPAADIIALETGDTSFLDTDSKGADAVANGAATDSATSIPFDGLTVAGAVSKYDLLQNGSELMQVVSVVYNPGNIDGVFNVTRGAYGTTPEPIADNTVFAVKNLLKISYLETATQDIVNYHGQKYPSGALWYYGNEGLARATALRAMYIARFAEARGTAEFIKNVSAGSYSDTVISISSAAEGGALDAASRSVVDSVLEFAGVASGEYVRA
jgi:hypothetical protein